MILRFLMDANMPASSVLVFERLGHECVHVRDMGMGGATDQHIATLAREKQYVLVTRDLDFSDSRSYPPEEHAGILLLRMPDIATAQEINDLLVRFAENPIWIKNLPGRLAILEPQRIRFRPPLIP